MVPEAEAHVRIGKKRPCARRATAALLGACGLLLAAPAARAPAQTQAQDQTQAPAVSGLNGKASVEGGTVGTSVRQSAIAITQGSITAPLGHSFGLQLDGAASTAFNSVFGSGGAHLFWRDPAIGLVGPVAAFGGGAGTQSGLYGGEAELYAGLFNVGLRAGYASSTSAFGSLNGGFYLGTLTLYPVPDFALSIEGGQLAGFTVGQARIEYQPDLAMRRNVSFYATGIAGDLGVYRATEGVRFYFGSDKPLIRRHREDDPPSVSSSALEMLTTGTVCGSFGGRHVSVGGCTDLPISPPP